MTNTPPSDSAADLPKYEIPLSREGWRNRFQPSDLAKTELLGVLERTCEGASKSGLDTLAMIELGKYANGYLEEFDAQEFQLLCADFHTVASGMIDCLNRLQGLSSTAFFIFADALDGAIVFGNDGVAKKAQVSERHSSGLRMLQSMAHGINAASAIGLKLTTKEGAPLDFRRRQLIANLAGHWVARFGMWKGRGRLSKAALVNFVQAAVNLLPDEGPYSSFVLSDYQIDNIRSDIFAAFPSLRVSTKPKPA